MAGLLRATPQTLETRLNDGLAGLFGYFTDEKHARRLANKATRALNDLSPVGNATGAEQGARTARQGVRQQSAKQTLMGVGQMAMAVLPSAPKKIVQQAAGPLKQLFKGIRAYHGSPHDFDKFNLDKIGTGEGAQAYGHGLYFAENKDVARSYMGSAQVPEATAATWALQRAGGDRERAIALLKSSVKPGVKLQHSPALQAAEQLQQGYSGQRLYEVNLNASPDEFLDWDAPIAGQPRGVIDPLKRFGVNPQGRGEDAYSKVVREVSGSDDYWKIGARRPSAMATEALREAGLPGVRYLDQGSRGKGGGTRNYVVFDPALIDILNKY